MSNFNLRDFNALSKRHNYFMSNYLVKDSPFLNENSIVLKKIVLNRSANSSDKRLVISNNISKPKKSVGFAAPEFIPFQSPKINNDNIPKEIFGYQIYKNNLNKNNIKNNNNIQTPYKNNIKIMLNRKINRKNYNKFIINKDNKIPISPDVYTKPSRFHSNSNLNDSDNEMLVLNYKGRKIFSPNSFRGIKSFTANNSPEKKEINRIKESELYRNSLDLRKKKEEIYSRKMKKESSSIIRDMLKKEKEKDIKEGKIDIEINTKNNFYTKADINLNSKNKMRIIPLNSEINNNNKKNKNNNFILNGQNLTNNNSFTIKMKNRKKTLLNSPISENNIRRIYKMQNKNTDIRNSNEINKNEEDSKLLKNNKSLNFKSNNIFLSKFSERTPPKNIKIFNSNNRIKDNLELLRKSKNKKVNNDIMEQKENKLNNNKINSIFPINHNNPYKYMSLNKRFCEDYEYEAPIIYSKDKKVSIKVHALQNINELFLGKKPTKEKLKMQRVNIFSFNNKSHSYFRNKFSKKNKENKPLRSIKEEEEKFKVEQKPKTLRAEQKIEIKEKPVLEKNIRRKYLRRFENKQ